MIKGMCITYTVDRGLYINVTNRCTNSCDFCIRNNGDGAYGSDPLWLTREPTVEEIVNAVFNNDLSDFSEIVFCGYGEPACRLYDVREVALKIKEKHPEMKVRINTNGQSDLIFGIDTASLYQGAFDSVSISLNTPSAKIYDEICHSVYGCEAHSALINFAKNVKKYVPEVLFSVVKETLTESELNECRAIAESAGVTLKVRNYISAEDSK